MSQTCCDSVRLNRPTRLYHLAAGTFWYRVSLGCSDDDGSCPNFSPAWLSGRRPVNTDTGLRLKVIGRN